MLTRVALVLALSLALAVSLGMTPVATPPAVAAAYPGTLSVVPASPAGYDVFGVDATARFGKAPNATLVLQRLDAGAWVDIDFSLPNSTRKKFSFTDRTVRGSGTYSYRVLRLRTGKGAATVVTASASVALTSHPVPPATWAEITASTTGGVAVCGIGAEARDLWCWGWTDRVQHQADGSGVYAFRNDPIGVPFGGSQRWKSVAVGDDGDPAFWHACAVAEVGTLWCWGEDAQIGNDGGGVLGLGAVARVEQPTQVGTASDWESVATGASSTCGIRADGTLWCWGNVRVLGVESCECDHTRPVQMGTDTDWQSVSVGSSYAGYNVSNATPSACAIKTTGELWCWGRRGDSTVMPTRLGSDADWTQVSVGAGQACAVKAAGSMWCWGWWGRGWASDPLPLGGAADWASVRVGDFGPYGVKADGTVWTWSLGSDAAGTASAFTAPVRATFGTNTGFPAGTAEDNSSLVGSGTVPDGNWVSYWPIHRDPVLGSSPSTDAGCGLKTDGTAWCWNPPNGNEVKTTWRPFWLTGRVGRMDAPPTLTAPAWSPILAARWTPPLTSNAAPYFDAADNANYGHWIAATPGGWFGEFAYTSAKAGRSFAAWRSANYETSAWRRVTPGQSVCVLATIADGMTRLASRVIQTCGTAAIDDRSFTRSGKASRVKGKSFYRRTATRLGKGASISGSTRGGMQAYLVARTCRACGTVRITYGTRTVATVSLHSAATRNRVVIALPALGKAKRIKVTSTSRKQVLVDGIAFRPRNLR
ncbi:hypothetical protein [Nocardioides sp.]|uniref:hypothetical protein n=1 Tax=Nocardioides sp. TaxID=35761 RepID=UPI0039E4EDDC